MFLLLLQRANERLITIAVASQRGQEGNKVRRNYKIYQTNKQTNKQKTSKQAKKKGIHTCYSPLAVPDPLIADATVRQQAKMVVVAHQSTDYT